MAYKKLYGLFYKFPDGQIAGGGWDYRRGCWYWGNYIYVFDDYKKAEELKKSDDKNMFILRISRRNLPYGIKPNLREWWIGKTNTDFPNISFKIQN